MHVAIIADGNRRWARQNNLPIELGYIQGLVTIENLCVAADDLGINQLSFYCFSTENWARADEEKNYLFSLARDYFRDKQEWYRNRNIRVKFRGRRDRLPKDIIESMQAMEQHTIACDGLELYILIDYGGRDEIVEAINHGARTEQEIDSFIGNIAAAPDIIVRTGGNRRLSNFLLWQAAYAEIYFIDTFFPDLGMEELNNILNDFQFVSKNYGG